MTTPGPDVPVQPSLPEPEDLAMELETPGSTEGMATQPDSRNGTAEQDEQP